jgi:RHS repeat-associated protein
VRIGASPRPARWKNFREDYKFTGKEEDVEVGIQYFGKRFLNPYLGRWMSADPLAVHALGADLNLYAYVKGAILRAIDPNGLQDQNTGGTSGAGDVLPPSLNAHGSGNSGDPIPTPPRAAASPAPSDIESPSTNDLMSVDSSVNAEGAGGTGPQHDAGSGVTASGGSTSYAGPQDERDLRIGRFLDKSAEGAATIATLPLCLATLGGACATGDSHTGVDRESATGAWGAMAMGAAAAPRLTLTRPALIASVLLAELPSYRVPKLRSHGFRALPALPS